MVLPNASSPAIEELPDLMLRSTNITLIHSLSVPINEVESETDNGKYDASRGQNEKDYSHG